VLSAVPSGSSTRRSGATRPTGTTRHNRPPWQRQRKRRQSDCVPRRSSSIMRCATTRLWRSSPATSHWRSPRRQSSPSGSTRRRCAANWCYVSCKVVEDWRWLSAHLGVCGCLYV